MPDLKSVRTFLGIRRCPEPLASEAVDSGALFELSTAVKHIGDPYNVYDVKRMVWPVYVLAAAGIGTNVSSQRRQ